MSEPTLDELISRVEHPAGDRLRQDDDRCYAAAALERLGPAAAPALLALRRALRDSMLWSDWDYRCYFADAIGAIGPAAAEAVPELLEAMTCADCTLSAAQALGKIGPGAAAAIPKLERLERNLEDGEERAAVREALGRIRGEGSPPSA